MSSGRYVESRNMASAERATSAAERGRSPEDSESAHLSCDASEVTRPGEIRRHPGPIADTGVPGFSRSTTSNRAPSNPNSFHSVAASLSIQSAASSACPRSMELLQTRSVLPSASALSSKCPAAQGSGGTSPPSGEE